MFQDEIDFEFLGTDGPLYSSQTNIFANDIGGTEERLHLWFDPTLTFHYYGILWNSHHIVIWNGEAWASQGKKVDWSQAPFQANYKGFGILGCTFGNQCDSETFSWNRRDKWELNPKQQQTYEDVKRKYRKINAVKVFFHFYNNDRKRSRSCRETFARKD
ncbi:unnamed protein product [Citrullus colocynthis]|uniref:GH16 domain-containing protein n=1 Tax=Citrullus colocynthis TaxID=252529 RepID=A0ABP0YMX5_9ROSI